MPDTLESPVRHARERPVIHLPLLALLIVLASRLQAQRVAPSAVQRLVITPPAVSSADKQAEQGKSHVDGAVHGATVGGVAGALTGVAVYVVAHAFVSSQDVQVVTSNDKPILFWWSVGAGALAGGTLGAVIGGIMGR